MKIKFHHWLALFIVTLFIDYDFKLSFARIRVIDVWLLCFIATSIFKLKQIKIPKGNSVSVCLLIYVVYVTVNSLLKVSFADTTKEVLQLLEYIFIMFLIANEMVDNKKRHEFLNILMWGAGAIAAYSMIYHISLGMYSGYKKLDAPKHAFAVFALLAVIKYVTTPRRSSIQILTILAAFAMLLLSGERKGWAGAIIGICIFLFSEIRTTKRKGRVVSLINVSIISATAFTVAIITLSGLSEFKYFDRQIGSITDVANHLLESESSDVYASSSNAERTFMFNFGLMMFDKYPLMGIGIDQFNDTIEKFTGGRIVNDAHNFFLKILVEEGLLGLSIFLLINFLIIKRTIRLMRVAPQYAQFASIILAIFFLGTTVNFFLAGKALSWLYIIVPPF